MTLGRLVYRVHIFGQRHHEIALPRLFGAGESSAAQHFRRHIVGEREVDLAVAQVFGKRLQLIFSADKLCRFDLCAARRRGQQDKKVRCAGDRRNFPELMVRDCCSSGRCCSTTGVTFPSPPTSVARRVRVSPIGRIPESDSA